MGKGPVMTLSLLPIPGQPRLNLTHMAWHGASEPALMPPCQAKVIDQI